MRPEGSSMRWGNDMEPPGPWQRTEWAWLDELNDRVQAPFSPAESKPPARAYAKHSVTVRPWCKTPRGLVQDESLPSKFIFFPSSHPTFFHLPLGPQVVGSEAFSLQDGVHSLLCQNIPLTILPTLARFPLGTWEHTLWMVKYPVVKVVIVRDLILSITSECPLLHISGRFAQ